MDEKQKEALFNVVDKLVELATQSALKIAAAEKVFQHHSQHLFDEYLRETEQLKKTGSQMAAFQMLYKGQPPD
jgi:hypothetical protein